MLKYTLPPLMSGLYMWTVVDAETPSFPTKSSKDNGAKVCSMLSAKTLSYDPKDNGTLSAV